jgi:hypothetical protein
MPIFRKCQLCGQIINHDSLKQHLATEHKANLQLYPGGYKLMSSILADQ